MQFSELLDQIRSHYVERLLEAIAEQRENPDVTIVHEPALRDEDGEIAESGPMAIPMRVDIVMVEDGEVVDSLNVDTEDMLAFEPFSFTWPQGELEVTIEPFQWNWLQLQTNAEPEPEQWHAVRNWYIKWFGEDDPAVDQLAGAVHFLDDPLIEDEFIQLTMDLGTAPIECFEQLLDAMGQFGGSEVWIGHATDEDEEDDEVAEDDSTNGEA